MSSSSSTARRRPSRVLRDETTASHGVGLAALDLAPAGLARLDPDRIDAAVAAGHRAGYEAGYAAGEAAARESTRAAQAQLLAAYQARLAQVVEAAELAVADALSGVSAVADAAARVTAGAAFSVAEAIVGRELALATDPGRDAVARALALTPEGVDLTLRLHPDDAADLGAGALPPGRAITVVADPTLARGDCVADAGWTRVDARISTALERVRAALEAAG